MIPAVLPQHRGPPVDDDALLEQHYYLPLAAAFVRGRLGGGEGLSSAALLRYGRQQGLRLHKFKRTTLPRVRKVLGVLRGLSPQSLIDIGSGRGVFLWPLLDAFPELPVTAIDRNPIRVADIAAVARGGVPNLSSAAMDAHRLALADRSVEVVTALEVLEHLADPGRAVAEAVRVAQLAVVASVPAHADTNPEHIHLFTRRKLETMFLEAGARRVTFDGVLNHIIVVARV
jgi:ubiquinone/menaquinone biosynthesis C-methylase UbiE